jgi:predicted regulator of Ras-like GTPase activity (Roadblock/LC7/MglB family)
MIQNFLIMRRTGENIYKKSFRSIDMDETVMSGFFSAFFTFTQHLCGADLDDIELGPYRMLFEAVGKDLILVIIFDKSDSIINVHQKLTEIRTIIESKYSEDLKRKLFHIKELEGFSETIESIITRPQLICIEETRKNKFLEVLNKLCSVGEILDCTIISMDGIPLSPQIKKEFLDLVIKQMDAFWKYRKDQLLDQIIVSFENRYIILQKVDEHLVLAALAKKSAPIGLITLLIEEGANKNAQIR